MSIFSEKQFNALHAHKINSSGRLAYLVTVSAIRDHGFDSVSYDFLAEDMGLSHDRTRKSCAPLVKAGLITIEYRRNRGHALIRLVQL